MLIVYGNATSDNKEKLLEIGAALEKQGFVIAYNTNYFNLVIMKNETEKRTEEESE